MLQPCLLISSMRPSAVDEDSALARAVENRRQLFLGQYVLAQILVDEHRPLEGVDDRLHARFDQIGLDVLGIRPLHGDGVADDDVGVPFEHLVHLALEGDAGCAVVERPVVASQYAANRLDEVDELLEARDGDLGFRRRFLEDVGQGPLHRRFNLDDLDVELLPDQAGGAAAADDDLGALADGAAGRLDAFLQVALIDLGGIIRGIHDALGRGADALERGDERNDHLNCSPCQAKHEPQGWQEQAISGAYRTTSLCVMQQLSWIIARVRMQKLSKTIS